MSKNFREEIYFFLDKIKSKENFAIPRYSDGEMFMLQRKSIHLGYKNYDAKHFIPAKHEKFVKYLTEAFVHKQHNYYKGISCKCCVGEENLKWQLNLLPKDDNLTWANVFLNANYPIFMKEVLPEIQKRGAVYICNNEADLSEQDWIFKDFRVSSNQAFITDLHIIDEISEYIEENQITDTLFLFSASALSNLAIYELFKKHPNNTYLDIGTTIARMTGVPVNRRYLNEWHIRGEKGRYKTCIW
jgi:hypothetical protein